MFTRFPQKDVRIQTDNPLCVSNSRTTNAIDRNNLEINATECMYL